MPHLSAINLIVDDADAAIAFYTRAFGARENYRLPLGDGRIGHSDLEFAGLRLSVSDAMPEWGFPSAGGLGGSPVSFNLDVDDPEAAVQQAVDAGAELVDPVADQFYGWRMGVVRDPFGFRWLIGKQIEEVSVEEMQRRNAEYVKQFASS